MKFKSLSASSVSVYEGCPARFAAEYCATDRAQDLSAGFAELGTACHEALEMFVNAIVACGMEGSLEDLLGWYDDAYWKLFTDLSKYDDGVEMLTRWHERQDWEGREVLLTEVKETFELPYGKDLFTPVTYIWDRCDKITNRDGSIDIDVVDYKTYRQAVPVGELKLKIQPRLYALAAAIRFRELNPKRIWVTYDLLRHEPVSVAFTREENQTTWRYLKAVAKRIAADEEPKETLNPDCRWCIRRSACDTLRIHRDAGGILDLLDSDNIDEAIDTRNAINDQTKALNTLLADIDKLLLDHMQHHDLLELTTESTTLKVGATGRRYIDAERAAIVLGPTRLAHHAKLNMGDVDSLLKSDELTIEEKADLKRLIGKNYSAPSISTKSRSPHAEDE